MITPEIAAVLLDILEHPVRSICELTIGALALVSIVSLVLL